MPLFVLTCLDRPGALETRMATRERHLAYGNESGVVRAGGAFLDAEGKPEGSMIIVEVEDIEAAKAFAAADPYAIAGVFASTDVRLWRMALGGFA
jgi:hypothetical protein